MTSDAEPSSAGASRASTVRPASTGRVRSTGARTGEPWRREGGRGAGPKRSRGRGRRRRRGRSCRGRRAAASSTATPRRPGSTARIPPRRRSWPAARPRYNHSPAPSYIPQLAMTERTWRTTSPAHRGRPRERVHAAVRERRTDRARGRGSRRGPSTAGSTARASTSGRRRARRRPQQVRDRAVAMPGDALGLEHRLVDVEGPSGEGAVRVQHGGERRPVARRGRRR